jgi:glycerol-3-phosphate dehydrogenase subunit C
MIAEDRLRDEIAKCRRCEACRELVDSSCLVFPVMFRLVDQERDTGEKISSEDLIQMVNLCNLCGICPCRDIRSAILNRKTEYVDQHGLDLKVRIIEGIERIGKLGGAFPRLSNFILQHKFSRGVMQNLLGIHQERKFPRFPNYNFEKWWHAHKHAPRKNGTAERKVAYFAGCTARYLFPEVATATVEAFNKSGVEVYVPQQKCCGMPTLLEGDRRLTVNFVKDNVERWADIVEQGFDIICSCPTCGYMLKTVISAGAEGHRLNRLLDESSGDYIEIPVGQSVFVHVHPQADGALRVPIKYVERLVQDTSYFTAINPEKRLRISENTYDVGEYLWMLHQANQFDTNFGRCDIEAVYYPPCHLREQRIDSPYQDLLNLIPGVQVESIRGNYCCGNAGIMGFKNEFYQNSIKIAGRLISKIKQLDPELLTTECLSCRLQFNQLTPYRVRHPIEIIRDAYRQSNEKDSTQAH